VLLLLGLFSTQLALRLGRTEGVVVEVQTFRRKLW